MAWRDLDPSFRKVVERACTRTEVEVLALVAEGYGLKKVAKELRISRQVAQRTFRRAERKIQHEVALMRGYDNGR